MSFNMMNSYQNNAGNSFQGNRMVEKSGAKTCDFKDRYALRKDLIGELEAINQYDLHIQELNSESAKLVLASIRDEEIVHSGELIALLDYLCPNEATLRAEGKKELMEILGKNSKG